MTNNNESVLFLPLGGEEDVTRNLYVYEYNNQILLVDCGVGFPDETMLGVDLLLPDITYLLDAVRNGKKIVGMVLTHGHEDHIGGLPFILPQLPQFPIYASPLTSALANEKLSEFNLPRSVKQVNFSDADVTIGPFTISFIHVTHSVPDTANFIITTPVGNFFHGSDFKFDLTPSDNKKTEFTKIVSASQKGVLALVSDCLGADRKGHTESEQMLEKNFADEIRDATGKVMITTYSSNISRLNQAVHAAEKMGRKVCFVGRSMLKVKEIGKRLGYLQIKQGTEITRIEDLKKYRNNQLVLLVAGSQGQENSALSRIARGEHKDIKLDPGDLVIFSSDVIPGNELPVNALIDTLIKRGGKIAQSEQGMFHVSGHGSSGDHMLLIALTTPRFLVPISGTYRMMVAYQDFAMKMGYTKKDIFLLENGQSVLFTKTNAQLGRKFAMKKVFVDEVSGEELETFIIRDRERLAKEGLVVIVAEVKTEDGQLVTKPEIILRGSALSSSHEIAITLADDITKALSLHKEKVTNWGHIRRIISQTVGKYLAKKFRTHPLILPVVIEL